MLGTYDLPECEYDCTQAFQFCSNKRPSGEPGFCEEKGGYPDNLNLDTATYSDYSQYQTALALKPCFDKEMEEDLTIPIEIGDEILGGKFKNKNEGRKRKFRRNIK